MISAATARYASVSRIGADAEYAAEPTAFADLESCAPDAQGQSQILILMVGSDALTVRTKAVSSMPLRAWLTASFKPIPALRSSSAAAANRGFSLILAVSYREANRSAIRGGASRGADSPD